VKPLTVSRVARRVGITVRTLHHYEAIGLLVPSRRSASGYRLYGTAELLRLQHIVSLKALGLSLEEIRSAIERSSLSEAIERQIERVREAIDAQRALLSRLELLARQLTTGGPIGDEQLIETIEASTMFEKYYTKEQLETLAKRRDALGENAMQDAHAQWQSLIEAMQAHRRAGTPPDAPDVAALARRWRDLVRRFSGGDKGIEASAAKLWREQAAAMEASTGIDPGLMTYAGKAVAALKD
jgi:DNA-binding transcriptional MerR regulator